MKKYFAILGLLAAFSTPAFAMSPCSSCCPTILPREQAVAVPVQACPCNPCVTGAACPVVISNPCCDPCCNPCLCCPKDSKGFWRRFFGY